MKTLEVDTLKQWILKHDNALILNVLDAASHEVEHIPGSQNVPIGAQDFEEQVANLAGTKDRKIVVYCAGPDCPASEEAAKRLDTQGYTNVFDFEGGIKAWKAANEPVAAAH